MMDEKDENRRSQHRRHHQHQRLCKSASEIAIIGSGPGALSCALSLQQAGFQHLTLYERDADLQARKDGYGLTLTYSQSPTLPLAKLGLLEQVARLDCPSRSHYTFDHKGKILGYYGNSFSSIDGNSCNGDGDKAGIEKDEDSKLNCRGFGQRGNLRVPRQVLRKVMIDTLYERAENHREVLSSQRSNETTPESSADTSTCNNDIAYKSTKTFNPNRKSSANIQGDLSNVSIQWGKRLTKYTLKRSDTCAPNQDIAETTYCQDQADAKPDIEKPITLYFEDGSNAKADFLIGADGLRSSVITTLLSNGNRSFDLTTPTATTKGENDPTKLSYLGIMIVLGITKDFFHPLLDERGFYTLDGNHRLFTMPFEGSRICDVEKYGRRFIGSDEDRRQQNEFGSSRHTRRYMWQLSFNLDYKQAHVLARDGPQRLLAEVLSRTEGWHIPVHDMIRSTPLDTIWGTPLMDRDPSAILNRINDLYKLGKTKEEKDRMIRTVVCGDAVHAMSPFKGQGCNQALMDGTLLAEWLSRSKLDSAVKGFNREMVQRTHKKVIASREAARYLHSPDVFDNCNTFEGGEGSLAKNEAVRERSEKFSGVEKGCIQKFLKILNEKGINANSFGDDLDSNVGRIIQELGIYENKESIQITEHFRHCQDVRSIKNQPNFTHGKRNSNDEEHALQSARYGDTAGLRALSIDNPISIHKARSQTGETCLHLAAKVGSYYTVKWLLSEASISKHVVDQRGQSPLHAAVEGGDLRVVSLLARISKNYPVCWNEDLNGNTPAATIHLHSEAKQKALHDALHII